MALDANQYNPEENDSWMVSEAAFARSQRQDDWKGLCTCPEMTLYESVKEIEQVCNEVDMSATSKPRVPWMCLSIYSPFAVTAPRTDCREALDPNTSAQEIHPGEFIVMQIERCIAASWPIGRGFKIGGLEVESAVLQPYMHHRNVSFKAGHWSLSACLNPQPYSVGFHHPQIFLGWRFRLRCVCPMSVIIEIYILRIGVFCIYYTYAHVEM